MAEKEKRKKKAPPAEASYWQTTRQPLYSLVFVLPMLLFYEVGIVLVNVPIVATRGYPVRNYSDEFLRDVMSELFSRIGLGGIVVSGMLVVAVFLVWQIASRRPWKVLRALRILPTKTALPSALRANTIRQMAVTVLGIERKSECRRPR
jgi:hypothetical protein